MQPIHPQHSQNANERYRIPMNSYESTELRRITRNSPGIRREFTGNHRESTGNNGNPRGNCQIFLGTP
eukprot:3458448-Karenia_brevis.AAC.1